MKIGKDNAVALSCVAGVVFMTGAAFAAVPLYKLYCQVTGYGGTTQRAIEPSHVMLDRVMTVRFDANVTPGMKWKFEPMQKTLNVKLGENALAFYKATNYSDKTITGTAAFNVAPDVAGVHFSKVQCFCFKEQTLAPGETVDVPVSFFVAPAIASDPDAAHLTSLTLSYTFYPVEKPQDTVATKQGGEPGKGS